MCFGIGKWDGEDPWVAQWFRWGVSWRSRSEEHGVALYQRRAWIRVLQVAVFASTRVCPTRQQIEGRYDRDDHSNDTPRWFWQLFAGIFPVCRPVAEWDCSRLWKHTPVVGVCTWSNESVLACVFECSPVRIRTVLQVWLDDRQIVLPSCCLCEWISSTSQAWFTIYARDGCEAARLRANSSEKVFTKHAGVFTKFSCLRDFATGRADHHGVRPHVYRRIYNTQVYQYGRNKMALACKKEGRIGFSFFVRCFVLLFFPLFLFFFIFFQIPIAAKIIEKLRHMQYLDFKIRYEVVRAPSPWKLDYLKNKRAVLTRKTTKEVQKKEEDEG